MNASLMAGVLLAAVGENWGWWAGKAMLVPADPGRAGRDQYGPADQARSDPIPSGRALGSGWFGSD
ncbi:hypothetical protein GCM10009863_65010 [Streptomyces axinellae]|uniref:Uncharacterized protein n=1 Tax=Streptomyces axinellae TaxID=552788 RepID=A0ABN3QZ06_9ACTN